MRVSERTSSLLLLTGWLVVGCAEEPAPQKTIDPSSQARQPRAAMAVKRLESPAGSGALAPRLTADGDRVWLSWLEPEADGYRFMTASLDPVSDRFAASGEVARGDDFFANWADLPAVVPAGDGRMVGHWLARLGEGTYAYGIHLAASGDGGREWTPAGLLHADDSPQEHGFVSWGRGPDGDLVAAWLDGRAMTEGGPMQLLAASVSGAGQPGEEVVLDERVCECCATGAAWTAAGPIVVYRDRDDDDVRDIWRVRWRDGAWSEPAPVAVDGWQINGCPVNGPQVAAEAERVAVAWFTAADERPRVQIAFSGDAGESFGAPLVIDEDGPVGRVALILDGEAALVTWVGRTASGQGEAILVRRAAPEGRLGPIRALASTSSERAAGFPAMARAGDQVVWAWVEPGEPARLAAAVTPLADLR